MKQATDIFKYIKILLVVFVSYLTTLSFGHIFSLENTNSFYAGKYFGYNPGSVLLFAITLFLLLRFLNRSKSATEIFAVVGGILLATAIVCGAYVHYKNNIFISMGITILQLAMISAISALTIPLFSEVFCLLSKAREKLGKANAYRADRVCVQKEALFFFVSWAGIFIAFLPVFLCEWPGNFNVDAPYQLQNVIAGTYKTHHPLAHTLLMGKAYEFGCRIGNASAGYQIYTLIQMLILSSSFAYAGLYLYRKFTLKCIWIGVICWYALFPIHMIFAITSTKDVIFAAFFLYFLIFVIRLFSDEEKFKWFDYAGLVFSGTGALLFRNNMSYALILSGVVALLFIKGWKKKLLMPGLFIGIYLLATLLNHGMIQATNAYEGATYRESLSVPLQCLARVAAYKPEELEEITYQEICMYIEESQIAAYNPYNSDPIKNTANEELLKSNFGNFLKLFIKTGVKFPDEYIESFVTNTMGYWYPINQGYYVSTDIASYHMLIGMGAEIKKESKLPIGNEIFKWLFFEQNYRNLPLVGFFCRNAVYLWGIVGFLLFALAKGQKKVILPGIICLCYLLTCLAGPLAALRYIYCIIVSMPVLLGLLISPGEPKIGNANSEESRKTE